MCLEEKVEDAKVDNIPVLANKNLFINFWMRIYEFIIKLINPRTAIFVVATWLVTNESIDQWVWLVISAIFMGERWVKTIKELLIEIKK